MNNTSLTSADGATHLKIVVVSLVAGILVIGVGVAARPNLDMSLAGVTTEAKGPVIPVIKAGQPVVWTSRDTGTIR